MYAPTQVVLVISTNVLVQSTLDKLWSPVSPRHLWRPTTRTRSTTSTLWYFMPFPVNNLRWVWSPSWPQDTSARRSMSTSVSGNQIHICCGNRFQHRTWWIRVRSAHNPVPWSLCPPQQLNYRYCCWNNIPANLSKHMMSDYSWSLVWWCRYNILERHAQFHIWMERKFRGRCCPLLACLVILLLLKIAVKDHVTLIVAGHHLLDALDAWSGSFSIFGTAMTSTMIIQDGINIHVSRRGTGWSSWAFCFFYSIHNLLVKM